MCCVFFLCCDVTVYCCSFFFFSSRRRHTRSLCDWSSDVCSSDLLGPTILHLRPSGRSVRKAFCKWDKTLTRDKLRLFHRSKRLVYGKPNSFWRTSSANLSPDCL